MYKRGVLLATHNFNDPKNLANNAKIRSLQNLLLVQLINELINK